MMEIYRTVHLTEHIFQAIKIKSAMKMRFAMNKHIASTQNGLLLFSESENSGMFQDTDLAYNFFAKEYE